MNWFTFLVSLAIGYVIYYVLNILYDLYFNNSKIHALNQQQEIIIPQHTEPTKVTLSSQVPNVSDTPSRTMTSENNSSHTLPLIAIQPTGGLNINELILLMQNEVIEYTKAIPY